MKPPPGRMRENSTSRVSHLWGITNLEIQEGAKPEYRYSSSSIAQRNYLRRFLPASVGLSMLSRPLKTASVKGPAPTEFNTLGGHLGFRCNR